MHCLLTGPLLPRCPVIATALPNVSTPPTNPAFPPELQLSSVEALRHLLALEELHFYMSESAREGAEIRAQPFLQSSSSL